MGNVLAIVNQKGGVGKTTTAINLAASLALAGKKILVIDSDPQGNSTSGLGINKEETGPGIYDVFAERSGIQDTIIPTEVSELYVIPSTIDLLAVEVELVEKEEREFKLRRAIMDIKDDYEYILIDCPPSLSLLTLNALTASHSVIIPVQCEYFALEGLGQLLNTINVIRKQLNPKLAINGVLLTMYDQRLNLSNQVVDEVKKYFGDKVFNTIIHRNVRISEAPSHAKPVILYDAISTGARNYISLASEVINRSNHKISGNIENE